MATSISRSVGNILRSDIDGRTDVRTAARLLASLLKRDLGDVDTFVLDVDTDGETGELSNLGIYSYDDFADLQEDEDDEEETD